jgi:hypothetical protein
MLVYFKTYHNRLSANGDVVYVNAYVLIVFVRVFFYHVIHTQLLKNQEKSVVNPVVIAFFPVSYAV